MNEVSTRIASAQHFLERKGRPQYQMNKETAAKITSLMEACLELWGEIVHIAHAECTDSEKQGPTTWNWICALRDAGADR